MPHLPDSQHPEHDLELIAAYAAGDATGPELERATAQVAACDECAALHHDLRSIAVAMAELPAPARSRSFTLTPEQAADLRPKGIRGLLATLSGPRFSFATPVGTGLAAIGIVGVLVASGGLPASGGAARERDASPSKRRPRRRASRRVPRRVRHRRRRASTRRARSQPTRPHRPGSTPRASSPRRRATRRSRQGPDRRPNRLPPLTRPSVSSPWRPTAPLRTRGSASRSCSCSPGRRWLLPASSRVASPAPPEPREPIRDPRRQGTEMPHLPDSQHPEHDLELIAAYAAGDAQGPSSSAPRPSRRVRRVRRPPPRPARDRGRHAGAARRPPGPRDFRLTPEQAARSARAGIRGLLATLSGPRFAFATPLGTGLAALGIVGVLVASGGLARRARGHRRTPARATRSPRTSSRPPRRGAARASQARRRRTPAAAGRPPPRRPRRAAVCRRRRRRRAARGRRHAAPGEEQLSPRAGRSRERGARLGWHGPVPSGRWHVGDRRPAPLSRSIRRDAGQHPGAHRRRPSPLHELGLACRRGRAARARRRARRSCAGSPAASADPGA